MENDVETRKHVAWNRSKFNDNTTRERKEEGEKAKRLEVMI